MRGLLFISNRDPSLLKVPPDLVWIKCPGIPIAHPVCSAIPILTSRARLRRTFAPSLRVLFSAGTVLSGHGVPTYSERFYFLCVAYAGRCFTILFRSISLTAWALEASTIRSSFELLGDLIT